MRLNDNFNAHDNWANEFVVLFEAPNELIMLHRNIIRGEEYIVMTNNLIQGTQPPNNYWCSMAEYRHILPYKSRIKSFQRKQDNFKLFKAFFKMTPDEFFATI